MRRLILPVAAIVAASSAFAAGDPFDLKVANIILLTNKKVQSELKITAAQRTKMNSYAQADEKFKASIVKNAQSAKQQQLTQAQQQQMASSFMKMRTSVLGVLTASQVKRLREITVQTAGPIAILDVNISAKIGVTDAQKKKIAAAYTDGQKQAQAVQKAAFEPISKKYQAKKPKNETEAKSLQKAFAGEMQTAAKKIAPKMKAIETSTSAKMFSLITSKQKTALEALKGKPFKA